MVQVNVLAGVETRRRTSFIERRLNPAIPLHLERVEYVDVGYERLVAGPILRRWEFCTRIENPWTGRPI